MAVKQFAAGSCLSYMVSTRGEAAVIDPHISLLAEYDAYLKAKALSLKYIIDTHTHADHFSLAAVMKKKYESTLLMGERAVSAIVNKRLKEGDAISVGEASLSVIATPGHTDDAISILADGMLFTGDVLLIGSVGRTDFQNGSPESMFETLQKLKALPDRTAVYPGHDYHEKRSSTISREKRANPFMREADKAAFVRTMRSKVLPKPFNIDNIVLVNQSGRAAALEAVSPREAQRLAAPGGGYKLIDVRSALEYSQEHIDGSVNIPIDMLASRAAELGLSEDGYIVLCRTGTRSPMAADMLSQAGAHAVKILDGGITRWSRDRLPVTKGEGGISLERQVRVIAGSLVLAGITLALFVDMRFIAISLFVGCGLVFAGLTDSCLMGMLLMKLPYNKRLYRTKLGGTCAMG